MSGALDFLISTIRDKEDIAIFGDSALPEFPKFVIIEAKSSSTVVDQRSSAQIWAQVLTVDHFTCMIQGLMFSDTDGLAGVLMDGLKFDFFFFKRGKIENGAGAENVKEEENFFKLYKAPALHATDKWNINQLWVQGLNLLL